MGKATEEQWLPLDEAATRMKRNADRIRTQIRNQRLYAGQHFRLKSPDVIELNVKAYLEWLEMEKERRKLPLVKRIELSYADQEADWYGGHRPRNVPDPRAQVRNAQSSRKQQLVPLLVWASQVFGEYAPPIRTLRIWARNGKILPAPLKVGREFFCDIEARCVDPVAERLNRINGLE